ncbi:MAG TPA: hypothetical protein VH041_08685 [Caldimonas sp.]|jgi:hypothetical protein|nr:hypothetical protein [Caldimonas sp.]HEX4234371.1 hypothetical protein [Caldimonas sp.]
MNAKHLFQLSLVAVALAAAATGAAAQSRAPTRADGRAAVLQARAAHDLIPAGEATEPFAARITAGAQRSRQDVRNEVLLARASGELVPAGQGMRLEAPSTLSFLARAEVKDSVRVARQRGELIPAGEGMGPVEWHARGDPARSASYAANRPR